MNNSLKKSSIKGKLAFVIGGSGLIGKEVLRVLINSGCKTINLDLKNHNNKKDFSKIDNLRFNKFDCSHIDCLNDYKKIVKKFGLPDIIINCSYPKTKDWHTNSFKNIKYKSLKKNLETNLVISSLLIRQVAEMSLKNKKRCSIVLLASIYGLVGQDNSLYFGTTVKENIAYSIIKGGIVNLTKQMASYYSKFGIRINNVCPGGVFDEKNQKNKHYKKLVKNYSKRSPIKRMALPQEIALPIVFLSSEAASYITGSTLIVDGGWTAI